MKLMHPTYCRLFPEHKNGAGNAALRWDRYGSSHDACENLSSLSIIITGDGDKNQKLSK